MLAYLFWHRPTPEVGAADYEAELRAFHATLRSDAPPGFRGSAVFRLAEGYEDWYLVDDWAALGILNDAAIDATHRADHDAVARLAADGAGAIYKHIAGDLPVGDSGAAEWSRSRPDAEGEFALWQRQLVLGPAPEFCLLRRGSERVSVVSALART